MFIICFKTYFFPVYNYIRKTLDLVTDSPFVVFASINLIGILDSIKSAFNVDVFGISNMLLLIVISTALVDAYYGVRKSILESVRASEKSLEFELGSHENKKWIKISNIKKFQFGKLQFTFFKCFTLLGYLFFAKTLLNSDTDGVLGSFLGYTSALILKVPVALFWYYDFKSIGNNSAYVYGKKAFIFTIIESLFELKIKQQFEKLTNKNQQS